jgi:hypothetical protein
MILACTWKDRNPRLQKGTGSYYPKWAVTDALTFSFELESEVYLVAWE